MAVVVPTAWAVNVLLRVTVIMAVIAIRTVNVIMPPVIMPVMIMVMGVRQRGVEAALDRN